MSEEELALLLAHWKKCGMCGRHVPALVDDGPLCIRCDLVVYPEKRAA